MGGGWRWRDEVEGERPAGREGGDGVTLTEPAVDKTLRQIRQTECGASFVFHCSSCLVASPFSSSPPFPLSLSNFNFVF